MNIGICGVGGRMGNAILRIMIERGHKLKAAFEAEGSPFIGRNSREFVDSPLADCAITEINIEALKGVDGVIDFTSPSSSMKNIMMLSQVKKPVVIGTTGLSGDEVARIRAFSETIPVIQSPNMSLGVNLLFKLTEIASMALTTDYDVEIFEAHHRFKKDAPSGTAKRLLEIVKENMKGLSNAADINGRDGITGERTNNEIGMHAMRGGNIVGEHTVFYTSLDDRIELTHRAASRDVFARGAVSAVEYLNNRAPGFYTMYDVLGFK